jgi:chemotaxis protein MotB
MVPAPPSAPPAQKPGQGNVVPIKPGAQHGHKGGGKGHAVGEEEVSEEHSDSNWIVSYADMMTLLCVFFVLMYSLSKPDVKKLEEIKKETTKYFGGAYKVPFENLVDKIRELAKAKGLEKIVTIEADESGVSATFHGTIFFESGRAELLPDGLDILSKMGDVIKREAPGFKIVVEGHTDDNPIKSPIYPSNWELSGARASRVIRMFESMGFDRKLLTGIGYSDTRPVLPNRDANNAALPLNQSQNRRVVLRVLRGDY